MVPFEDIELATNYWTTIGEGSLGLSSDDQAFQGYAMTIFTDRVLGRPCKFALNVEKELRG